MYPRTEDLLSIRDHEPVDADTRARLTADPRWVAEIERLQAVRERLCALPRLDPPAHVWQRVCAAAGADARTRSAASRRRWWAAAAVVASLAAAAVLLITRAPRLDPPAGADSSEPAVTAGMPQTSPASSEASGHAALIEESVRLERLLAVMPEQRPLMTAGTASTIAALEDQISLIDSQLAIGAVQGLEPPARQALWRERVDVMNALVQVRFAQSEWTGY